MMNAFAAFFSIFRGQEVRLIEKYQSFRPNFFHTHFPGQKAKRGKISTESDGKFQVDGQIMDLLERRWREKEKGFAEIPFASIQLSFLSLSFSLALSREKTPESKIHDLANHLRFEEDFLRVCVE